MYNVLVYIVICMHCIYTVDTLYTRWGLLDSQLSAVYDRYNMI